MLVVLKDRQDIIIDQAVPFVQMLKNVLSQPVNTILAGTGPQVATAVLEKLHDDLAADAVLPVRNKLFSVIHRHASPVGTAPYTVLRIDLYGDHNVAAETVGCGEMGELISVIPVDPRLLGGDPVVPLTVLINAPDHILQVEVPDGIPVEHGDPLLGADPHPPLVILIHADGIIMDQTVLPGKGDDTVVRGDPGDPVVGPYPYIAPTVLMHLLHMIIHKPHGLVKDRKPFPVETGYSATLGAKPHALPRIAQQLVDVILREPVGNAEIQELPTVKTRGAYLRGKPDVAVGILFDVKDRVLRKSLMDGIIVKRDLLCLQGERHSRKNKRNGVCQGSGHINLG